MGQLDPEAVSGAVRRIEDGRREDTAVLARRLADQGALR